MYVGEILFCLFLLLLLIALFIGLLNLLLPKKRFTQPSVLQYERLDLLKGEISIISTEKFEQEIAMLSDKGYEFTGLAELYAFVENQIQFSEKAFVIFMSYDIAEITKPLAKKIFNQHRDVIFFRPVVRFTKD